VIGLAEEVVCARESRDVASSWMAAAKIKLEKLWSERGPCTEVRFAMVPLVATLDEDGQNDPTFPDGSQRCRPHRLRLPVDDG
jgi:hypothetical protein